MKASVTQIDSMIVDADYLAHRAYHAFTKPEKPSDTLRTSRGLESGVFFGFFSLLLRKMQDYSPKDIRICWGDRRENLFRKQISPEYKSDRHETPMSFISQCNDLKLCLMKMGMLQYFTPTFEADDIIGTLAEELQGRDVRIISGDKDLTQLVTETCRTVALAAGVVKHDVEYDIAKVIEKFGVHPSLMSDYLALLGDKGDCVAGVEGIGPKTASKLLNDNGPIGSWINNIPNINASAKIKERLLSSRALMVTSKRLVSLKQTSHIKHNHMTPSDFCDYSGTAYDLFNKYEIRKFRVELFTGEPHNA